MLSIVIPVFNCSKYTNSALHDLSKLEIPHEIIIVDNHSTDDTHDILKQHREKNQNIKVHCLNDNMGFGHANNAGYSLSIGTHVLFLNNDILVKGKHKDWPTRLMQDKIMHCQSGILNDKFEFIKEGKALNNHLFGYMSGWCLCAPKEIWNKLIINGAGPWNERFFLYFEDVDLSWRAKALKMEMQEVDIPVQHIARVTSKAAGLISHYHTSKEIMKKEWCDRQEYVDAAKVYKFFGLDQKLLQI